MSPIVKRSGGYAAFAADSTGMSAAVALFSSAVRSRYVLYYPAAPSGGGSDRLGLRVKGIGPHPLVLWRGIRVEQPAAR